MQKKLFPPILFFIALISINCNGQMMKTIPDVKKLKDSEQLFIGKPLSHLLKQIGLPIAEVVAIASESPKENPGFFRFRFQNHKTVDSLKSIGKVPTAIVVYIKEPFVWDYFGRSANKKNVWTFEDANKYGNLTVARIRILDSK